MSICPRCKETLRFLEYTAYERISEVFKVDVDGDTHYTNRDVRMMSDDTYSCPHCKTELVYDQEEAIELLEGE